MVEGLAVTAGIQYAVGSVMREPALDLRLKSHNLTHDMMKTHQQHWETLNSCRNYGMGSSEQGKHG